MSRVLSTLPLYQIGWQINSLRDSPHDSKLMPSRNRRGLFTHSPTRKIAAQVDEVVTAAAPGRAEDRHRQNRTEARSGKAWLAEAFPSTIDASNQCEVLRIICVHMQINCSNRVQTVS